MVGHILRYGHVSQLSVCGEPQEVVGWAHIAIWSRVPVVFVVNLRRL